MSYYNYLTDFIYYYLPYSIKYYYPNTETPKDLYYSLDSKTQKIIDSYLNHDDLLKLEKTIDTNILPTLREANKLGKYYIFKYLAETGNLITEYEALVSVQSGSLEILKYIIHTIGILPQNYLLDEALKSQNLEIIEYLVSIGLKPLGDYQNLKPEILEILRKFLE